MKTFKYETHLHTSQASACGSSSGDEYIQAFYDAGYTGIFVTDHFFGGNTCVPRNLPWKERIDFYCSGYELALDTADKFNKKNGLVGTENEFKVFFGLEQTFKGDDYLIYGLDKEWLYNNPQIETMNYKELFSAVNIANGLMIQAHPFRLRDYIETIHVNPRYVHGVEIYNAGNQATENVLAELYAKQYNFPVTSGSDIHNVGFIQQKPGQLAIGGMEFEKPLKTINDYIKCIKNHEGKVIK